MISVNRLAGKKVKEEELYKITKKALKEMGWKNSEVDISIAIVDDAAIKQLNKLYRKKDKVTDVLSFVYQKNYPNIDEKKVSGEIVISYNQAVKQAGEYNNSLLNELKVLLVHGVLHLAGYDHEKEKDRKKMNKMECIILGEGLCGRSYNISLSS